MPVFPMDLWSRLRHPSNYTVFKNNGDDLNECKFSWNFFKKKHKSKTSTRKHKTIKRKRSLAFKTDFCPLKYTAFQNELSDSMSTDLNSDETIDPLMVNIYCGNQKFVVSKERLRQESRYFDVMFNGRYTEGPTESITLNYVEPWQFEFILHHLEEEPDSECESIEKFTFRQKIDLLLACDMLYFKTIYDICKKSILHNTKFLTMRGFIELRDVAERIWEPDLLEAVVDHGVEIEMKEGALPKSLATMSWEDVTLCFVRKRIQSCATRDNKSFLSYRRVVSPANFLIAWVKHDPQNRLVHFEDSANKIPVEAMPSIYVLNMTNRDSSAFTNTLFNFQRFHKNHLRSILFRHRKASTYLLGSFCVDVRTFRHPTPVYFEFGRRAKLYVLANRDFNYCPQSPIHCMFCSYDRRLFIIYNNKQGMVIAEFDFIYGRWKSIATNWGEKSVPVSCAVNSSCIFVFVVKGYRRIEDAVFSNETFKLLVFTLAEGTWMTIENMFTTTARFRGRIQLIEIEDEISGLAFKEVEEKDEDGNVHVVSHVAFFTIDLREKKLVRRFERRNRVEGDKSQQPPFQAATFGNNVIFNLGVNSLILCDFSHKITYKNNFSHPSHCWFATAVATCGVGPNVWFLFNKPDGLMAMRLQTSELPRLSWSKSFSKSFNKTQQYFIEQNKEHLTLLSLGRVPFKLCGQIL